MRALLLLSLLAAAPAHAVVSPERSAPRVAHYDRAARDLGVRGWPPYFENRTGFHVFVYVGAGETRLTLWLPPNAVAPRDQLREAVRLGREMGWGDAQLYTGSYPWGTSFRAVLRAGGAAPDARRHYALDLAALRRWSRPLKLEPAWLGLRTERDRLLRLSPHPLTRGESQNADYAFYTGPQLAAGTLRVEHGLSTRWLAAMGSWVLLWFVFPTLTLLAASAHVRRLRIAEPVDRLKQFRTWQGATIGAAVGAAALASLWLFGPASSYLFGKLSFIPFAFSWIVVSGVVGLQGRLIGLPLERAAEPEKPVRPWYRVALGELVGSVAGLLVLGALVWFFTLGRATWVWSVGLDALFWLAIVAAGSVLLGLLIHWILARRRFTHGLEPVSEELGAAVRSRCDRLDAPVEEVLFAGLRTVAVRKGRVLLPWDLTGKVTPEQTAALAASEARFQKDQQGDRLGRGVLAVFVGAIVLLAIHSGIAMLLGGRPLMLLWILVGLGFPLGVLPVSRRWSRMRGDADLAAADTFENPRDYLTALQRLEEVQAANLDPALREQPQFSERRTKLQRRLGLD